jgi:hypothetical protein
VSALLLKGDLMLTIIELRKKLYFLKDVDENDPTINLAELCELYFEEFIGGITLREFKVRLFDFMNEDMKVDESVLNRLIKHKPANRVFKYG